MKVTDNLLKGKGNDYITWIGFAGALLGLMALSGCCTNTITLKETVTYPDGKVHTKEVTKDYKGYIPEFSKDKTIVVSGIGK